MTYKKVNVIVVQIKWQVARSGGNVRETIRRNIICQGYTPGCIVNFAEHLEKQFGRKGVRMCVSRNKWLPRDLNIRTRSCRCNKLRIPFKNSKRTPSQRLYVRWFIIPTFDSTLSFYVHATHIPRRANKYCGINTVHDRCSWDYLSASTFSTLFSLLPNLCGCYYCWWF